MAEVEAKGVAPLCGGSAACNVNERFAAPTVFVNPPPNLRLVLVQDSPCSRPRRVGALCYVTNSHLKLLAPRG